MRLSLPDIVVDDEGNPEHREFAAWFAPRTHLALPLLLQGYAVAVSASAATLVDAARSCTKDDVAKEGERRALEARLAEAQSIADERLAEAQRAADERLAEVQRTAAERMEEALRLSTERLTEAQRTAAERMEEARRLSTERLTEAQRTAAERLEEARRAAAERQSAISAAKDELAREKDRTIERLEKQLAEAAGRERLSTEAFLREALAEPHRREVAALDAEMGRLRAELDALKRSNAGKGAVGEVTLAAWLRGAFPAFEVVDSSRADASCDIHVRVSDKAFFAVEAKNKGAITGCRGGDVDKFQRDCAALAAAHGADFLGGLFVSLRSPNIPGRGPFAVEMTPELRPLVFVGFEEDRGVDHELLRRCVDMLVKVAGGCRGVDDAVAALRDANARLKPLVAQVRDARRDVDAIKAGAARIVKTCDGVYAALGRVFDEIARVAGGGGGEAEVCSDQAQACQAALQTREEEGAEADAGGQDRRPPRAGLACDRCGRGFQTERGRRQHKCRSP